MPPSSHPRTPRPARRRALLVYVAAWAATGLVVAATALVVLRGGDHSDDVTLPPVRQTELRLAAASAGCALRSGPGGRADEPRVDGPRARALAAGVYDEEQSPAALVGAMRRGVVVISYRRDVPEEQREELERLQSAVPRGTVVTRNDRMPYALAVTAWRRLLGCRRAGPQTLDAVRLFRGRYLGSGPDSPR